MIADVFKATCEAVWEQGNGIPIATPDGEVLSTLTFEIATLFKGRVTTLIDAGVDVIAFPDSSNALCGSRGRSVISTWDWADHTDALHMDPSTP